jgi:hypothetical protein
MIPAETDGKKTARSAWLRKCRAAFGRLVAWIEKTQGGKRVFKADLGRWPVVRYPAPGRLVMKAPYIGPRRVQNFTGWKPPVLTGLALGVLNWLRFKNVLVTPEAMAWSIGGTGIYAALFSIPFWRMAKKTRFKIRFIDGAMIWRGPDWKRYVVKPDEPRSLQALVPHRWAERERNIHDNWMRSHPGQPGPKPLFQISSEVVMNTGPGGMNWLPVAEFCNDGRGEHAHRLLEAIDYVTLRAGEELAALAREAAE